MSADLRHCLVASLLCLAAAHAQQAPFGGPPLPLPGVIEIENYDTGGSGVAYLDSTPTNTGLATLRGSDEVDITADVTGSAGHYVVDAPPGEWLEFTTAPSLSPTRSFANLTFRFRADTNISSSVIQHYAKSVALRQDGTLLGAFRLRGNDTSGAWYSATLEKVPMTSSASSVLRVDVMDSGEQPLIANKTAITDAELFDVIDVGSTAGTADRVALRSVLNGRHMRVTSRDHPVFTSGTTGTATDELIKIEVHPSGGHFIWSVSRTSYFSVTNTTTNVSPKPTTFTSNRERFTIESQGTAPGLTPGVFPIGLRVALKSVQASRYISISNNGSVRLDSLTVDQWVNKPPQINVGFPRTVVWPTSTFTLSATARELDPSGSLTARAWTQISGPNSATMGAPSTTTTSGVETTTVALSGLARGVYVFRFTSTDDMGDSSQQDLEVAVVDEAQHTLIAPTDSRVQFFGRVNGVGTAAPIIGWSGAGVKLRIQGTGCSVKMAKGSFPTTKMQFYVIVDGDAANARTIDMNVNGTITHLASGLTNAEHVIELYSLQGAWVAPTTFNGVLLPAGVTLLTPPARPERRMEFYGDSITEGGLMPDFDDTNTYWAYAAQAARLLNAEAANLSKSGLGLIETGYSGGSTLIGLHYRGLPWTSTSNWDFNLFKPQVVVINIMQNDKWLGGSRPSQEFIDAYVLFLRTLRAQHPNAHIVCCLGAMDATEAGSRFPGIVTDAVNVLRTQDNDGKLHTLFFPWLGEGTGHPSIAQAGDMAQQLKTYLDGLPVDVWKDGVEAPAGYHTWLNTNGITPAHSSKAQPLGDYDLDGNPNLMEYALAESPVSGTGTEATLMSPQAGGGMRFIFRKAVNDLTYRVECSTQLSGNTWSVAPWPITDIGGGFSAVTMPPPLGDCAFFRLVVEVP
jgi:hypothetical protein